MSAVAAAKQPAGTARVDHVGPLRNITISLTLACNQACSHCWVSAGHQLSQELSLDEIATVLLDGSRLGAEHVKFTGGDPLVKRGFLSMVVEAAQLGYRISIETNGMALNADLTKRLSMFADKIHFYVSLDGATAETHDAFRNTSGAFDRTTQNLWRLRDEGYFFSVQTVVGRHNIDEIPTLFGYAQQLGASQHKLILSIHNLGRGSDTQGDQISLDEMSALLTRLPAQEFWDYQWDPSPTRHTTLMTTLPPAFQPKPRESHSTCGWSKSYIGILANGDVAICHGLYDVDQAKAGNVREQSLETIWTTSPLLQTYRTWDRHNFRGICGNCAVLDSCRGLCRASAVAEYGDVDAPYPLCQAMFDSGRFPINMLEDPDADCTYHPRATQTELDSDWTRLTLTPRATKRRTGLQPS